MIYTDRTITVRKGESKIDEPIVVYRGDYELEVRFTITNSRFKFMSGMNLIDTEKASFGQMAILTPYGGNIFSDIVRCSDGTVTFVLTESMINQIEEIGLYSFQIRLYDYNKESRVSIPPIEFGIEVREPIASEDHDNSVNNAIVGYSIAKVVNPEEENVGDTFDEDGNYNKTKWETGDRISQGKLNKIEDAIDKVNKNEQNNSTSLGKRIDNNFNVLNSVKAEASELSIVKTQINNLVLESGGDSNLEVVQARGGRHTLNDRLDIEEKNVANHIKHIHPTELTNILDYESNLWVYGDVEISYKADDKWKYKDYVISGLEVGVGYYLSIGSVLNNVNSYLVEFINCTEHIPERNIPDIYKFKPTKSDITIRFQALSDVPAPESNVVIYSGISLRRDNLKIKDEVIDKQYDIRDINGMDAVFDIPEMLIQNVTISGFGGSNTYSAVRKDYYDIIPEEDYMIEYEEISGSKLKDNQTIVILTFYDKNDIQLGDNINILRLNGPKKSTFKTPKNTYRLQIHFMISLTEIYENHKVTWTNVCVYRGATKQTMMLKETAMPEIRLPDIDISQIIGMEQFIKHPNYLLSNKTVSRTGGTSKWTNATLEVHDIKPNKTYTLRYENVTNNRLPVGDPLIVYTCHDANNVMIQDNTNLFYVDGEKIGSITPPDGTSFIKLIFVVTLGETFGSDSKVMWTGVDMVEGKSFEPELNLDNVDLDIPTNRFDLHLPKDIYVAIGYPLEIYNHTVCRCINMDNYIFEWILPKGGGKSFVNKLLLSPGDSFNGTTDKLTLNVYDSNFKKIATQTSTVHYRKPTSSLSPLNPKKILCIGDSLTDISTWRVELYNRFSNDVAPNKIEYLGTLGQSPYFSEGHSGWSLSSFITDASEGWNGNYKILVTTEPNISPKKQYRFGQKIFEYEKTEKTGGEIWVYFNRISGGGFVSTADSPCKEVDSAVSGDTSITFTNASITSFNPFYNNGIFDSAYYSSTYLNGVKPDVVFIWLGTNGSSCTMDIDTAIKNANSEMKKYKSIVDNIKTNWPDTKIFVSYLHYRPDQNGQGNTNGTSNAKGWDNYIFEFNKQLFDTFDGYSNIIFIPVGQTFDRVNNYPNKSIPVNTRNTITMSVANDTVHMSQETGFLQVADAIYGAFINNI